MQSYPSPARTQRPALRQGFGEQTVLPIKKLLLNFKSSLSLVIRYKFCRDTFFNVSRKSLVFGSHKLYHSSRALRFRKISHNPYFFIELVRKGRKISFYGEVKTWIPVTEI